ncbi:hypothetical protein DFQ28_000859 [Apophysomyces sp. BC1034]|nr:hypothetical protein DFQ28_000859 [Apophysomyces sp. BC1034]
MEALHKGIPLRDSSTSQTTDIQSAGEVSTETGVLLALFAVGLIIGSPILGYLGSTLLFLFGSQYWHLLLARLLQGFSDACVWTLGMCLIADTFPLNTLGLQMGKVLLAHSVGLVVGAPVGVERRNQPKEWFGESAAPLDSLSETTANSPEEKKKQVSSLQLLSLPRLWASLVVAFAQGTVFNIFEPTLTVRLSTEFGYNSSQIGLVFLAQVIPTFVAAPLAGYFSDKYGPKVVSFSSLLLCIVTVALMGVPNASTPGGIAPLIVIFALQGFSAFALITPVLPELAYVVQAQNPEGGDDGQGRSYAFFNMAFASGK